MIKDLLPLDRPKEKALLYGIESLQNEELLAIILNSGVKGFSALDIAKLLLKDGIKKLPKKDIHQLQEIKGISKHKSLLLLAVFELLKRYEKATIDIKKRYNKPHDIIEHINLDYASNRCERLLLLIFNNYNQIIKEFVLAVGSSDSASINKRTIFSHVLKENAKRFVLIHNHPDGQAKPSKDDIESTIDIYESALMLDLKLLDHIIVADDGYFSFAESNFFTTYFEGEKII